MGSLKLDTCTVCGSQDWDILQRETQIARIPAPGRIVRCKRCGYGTVHPLPDAEALRSLYADDQLVGEYQATAPRIYISGDFDAQPYLAKRLELLERQAGGKGHLLDIGAARGVFLNFARSQGWQVSGVELSEDGVKFAGEHFGLELFRGTLEEARFPDETFDVVHLSHVLEHLMDLKASLAEMRRILKPGGVLAIEVPFEFSDLFMIFRERVLKRPRPDYSVPCPHISFFTPDSLAQLVGDSGFQVLQVTTPRRDPDLKSRLPLGGTIKRVIYGAEQMLRRGPLIELYARKG